ncbi:TonB-dependent receptor [Algoriphagus confluentis]|uniref:Carboxypeptidase-like regulatory domain-containing protein n=1 Tax=Algoriphagus confluentis TaxID=1697556 RepID=A0ABQ6PUA6_9BACT|nr:carboxypeptidase-like regulatory domain-containing protein [Algoriphagus confluentis]
MKHFIYLVFLVVYIPSAFSQQADIPGTFKTKIQEYRTQTGKQILLLDKDVSKLRIPSSIESIEGLPEALVKDTDYSFFEFQGSYIIIYPSYLKTRFQASESETSAEKKKRLYPVQGIIKDNEFQSNIAGALFSIPQLELAASTDEKGKFELQVPEGTYLAYFSSMGKTSERRIIKVYGELSLSVELFESINELDLVTVSDRAIDANVMSTLPGAARMPMEDLKLLPPLLGEVDLVKGMLLLPGVTTVGEGASGFNVRGGGVDQNLILMDGSPVFNPSHMFGFFGIFNPDAVKDAQLFKGDVPAEFGGRLSSVFTISTRSGDKEEWNYAGGIGFLSSRLGLNGPIGERTQVFASGRAAYPNWILKRIPNIQLNNSKTNFQDANLRIDHRINDRNTLALSLYSSSDYFKFGTDTAYTWRSNLASLKWSNSWGENLGNEMILAYSGYDYSVVGEKFPSEFEMNSTITYFSIQQGLEWEGKKWEGIKAGYQINRYELGLGSLLPKNSDSAIKPVNLPREQGLEGAVFVEVPLKFSENLQGQAGLRYSRFVALGPGEVLVYESQIPQKTDRIVEILPFEEGEVIQSYGGLEPRLAMRYSISEEFSLKASLNRNLQYLHLLTNNFASAPVDLWKLSDRYIRPQEAWQYAIGLYRNFKMNTIETSLEMYYKDMPQIVEYRDGARLFLNPNLETDLIMGEGYAYGSELLIRKNGGRINGWVAYTFSRSLRRVNSAEDIQINRGEYFPANWDQPHDLTFVGSYKPVRRVSFNATFNYRTGRPITLPSGIYDIGGNLVIDYQERNQARIPDYHRLDLAMTYYFYQKKNSKYKSQLTLSVYNVYGRRNAFSWFFQPNPDSGIPKSYRLAVIGTIIPSITYNFSIQ